MAINAWSFSRLAVFQQCKLRAKLQFVDKIPEPERPLPKGKTEHANVRGSRVHDEAEKYVRGNGEFPREASKFRLEFDKLQELFDKGRVSLEGDWGVDADWAPTGWRDENIWGRIKLDALVHMSDTEAVVIDYKTGRRFGNEIKHAEQNQLYQLATFLRYPKIQKVTAELWYLDQDELHSMVFSRAQGLRFFNGINNKATEMTTAVSFPPSPNIFACKYCPYLHTEHCSHGVS